MAATNDKNYHSIKPATARSLPKRKKTTTASTRSIDESIPIWQRELNDAQIDAVTKPLYSITRVVAGPGSGKTRVLTSRIAFLLKEDPKARILAVTFTRKAAVEMTQRLESLLKSNVNSNTATTAVDNIPASSNDDIIEEEEYTERNSSPTYVRDLARVTLGTFHKTCADILRYNGVSLSSLPSVTQEMMGNNATVLDGGFAIMDQSDQLRILKEVLVEKSIDLKEAGGIKPLEVLHCLDDIKSSIHRGEDPFAGTSSSGKKNAKPIPKRKQIALKLYRYYRETMLSNNMLDFNDLIYLAREMLAKKQEVRQQLHRRWTHILVDEYQDTSRAQIDLVRLWTSSSLLVVGDGDQSIYSWRDADPNSLSTFEEEFKSFLGGIETVHLKDNYRSTSNIVCAAQKVISSGEKSEAEKLRQHMTPTRGSGSSPRIVACNDGKAEANFVVKTIQKKLQSEEYYPDTTCAILYRTNAQSRLLEEACVNNNLPYVILGKATSFYKRREVKDCLSFLRFLYNGRDKGSMLRAFQTPSRGIGNKAIEQFEKYCALIDEAYKTNNKPPPTQLDILLSFTQPEGEDMPLRKDTIATRPLNLFTEFSIQMQEFHELAMQQPVQKVLEAAIQMFDLMAHFEKVSDSKSEFEERRNNVQELQHATRRYSKDGPALQSRTSSPNTYNGEMDDSFKSPLGAFLDDVALVTELSDGTDKDETDGDSAKTTKKMKRFVVSLMTIHAAKGMEFDSVFVVGNEEKTFPTSQAILAGPGSVTLAEECRLCYVAVTRAKTELFLTWRKEVADFNSLEGGFRFVKRDRSRFLDALVSEKKGNKKPTNSQGRKKSATLKNDVPRSSSLNSGRIPTYRATGQRQRKRNDNNGQLGQDGIRSYSNSVSPRLQRSQRPAARSPRREVYSERQPSSILGERSWSSSRHHHGMIAEGGLSSFTRSRKAHRASERPMKRTMGPTAQQQQPKQRRRSRKPMDSTWFFPVGSAVIHKRHGRGLVLNPPPENDDGELRVLVKFEDGRVLDFAARDDKLRPDF